MDFAILATVILANEVYWILGAIAAFVLLIILLAVAASKSPTAHWPTYKPTKHGDDAEEDVSHYLEQIKTRYGGYLFDNYRFRYGGNHSGSTEIDHILVTSGGIFVIETKGHTGTIKGNETDETWDQIKDNYEYSKTLKNPVIQNEGHIRALRKMFGRYLPKFTSVVIFVSADISRVDSDKVYNLKGAIKFIEELTMSKKNSVEYVKKIGEKLNSIQNENYISEEEHEQNVIDRRKS